MRPMASAQISSCLEDISAWMKEHHLQLNLAKTEFLVFPWWSADLYRSYHKNSMREASGRSDISQQCMQHRFSSRPLSFLGWTKAMLFWLDFHHLQMIAHLVELNELKRAMSHVSHLSALAASRGSHWVQVIGARLQNSSAPSYLRSLIYIASRGLWHLVVALKRDTRSLSRTFLFHRNLPKQPNPSQSSRNHWKLISFVSYHPHPFQLLLFR